MPFARHAVADSQGLAPPSRSSPTTASPDIYWQSKPHSPTCGIFGARSPSLRTMHAASFPPSTVRSVDRFGLPRQASSERRGGGSVISHRLSRWAVTSMI